MTVHFIIPGTPAAKARPRAAARIVGQGAAARAITTVYSDRDMVAAEREIARLYRIAAKGHRTLSGPVRLDLMAVFETPESWRRALKQAAQTGAIYHIGRPDLDNIEKLVLDALNRLAWADDGQVAMVTKTKRYGSPARVEVWVRPLDQDEAHKTPGQLDLERRVKALGWDSVLAPKARTTNSPKAKTQLELRIADAIRKGR